MSRVCEHHQEKPVRVYNQCIGCELKSLYADIERLTKERDTLQTAVKEYEFWIKNIGNPAKEANSAMREALEWYADDVNYKLGPNSGLGERARSVLTKIGEGEQP